MASSKFPSQDGALPIEEIARHGLTTFNDSNDSDSHRLARSLKRYSHRRSFLFAWRFFRFLVTSTSCEVVSRSNARCAHRVLYWHSASPLRTTAEAEHCQNTRSDPTHQPPRPQLSPGDLVCRFRSGARGIGNRTSQCSRADRRGTARIPPWPKG